MVKTDSAEKSYFYKNLLLPFVVLLLLVGLSTFFFNSAAQSYALSNTSIEAVLGTTVCRTSGSILAAAYFIAFIIAFCKKTDPFLVCSSHLIFCRRTNPSALSSNSCN